MDPKLLRMYSDLLNEQAATSAATNKGGKYNPFFTMPASQANPTGTGASSGIPINAALLKGSNPQAVKPTANSMAARGKVDAMKGSQATAAQTDTSSYTGKPQTSPAPTAVAAPARPDVEAGKVGIAAGGVAPAAGPTPEYNPDTDPSLAAGKLELAKAEPANVAASSRAGGYAQSATGAEGTTPSATQSALPASTGDTVGTGQGGTLRSGSGAAVTSGANIKKDQFGTPQFEEELEEESTKELEEELSEMMRLSGLPLTEKAVSKQQQKFMGMVHAMQKGEKIKGASPELKKVAKTMSKKDAKDFAKTKHKGLPQKVTEGLNMMLDEEGHTLTHIVNRFKHEVRKFIEGDFMPENLYDALYDYYMDRGDMPYGVAKARDGDPYQWVSNQFYNDIISDLGSDMNETVEQPVADDTLNELARLAGLSESRVDECGDMGMDQRDTFNVSTNMSSDGTKSVNISAQGDKAEELLSMLKLAGMGASNSSDRPSMIVVDRDEEMMDEERETEYVNTPDEEYQSIDSIIHQGNDLNREKRQYADKPKLGDNPMAEEVSLEEQFEELYNSVLVKETDPRRPKGDTGQAEIYTADLGIPPPSPDEGPIGKAPVAPKQPAAPKTPVRTPGAR
jgi:hypothetical protein